LIKSRIDEGEYAAGDKLSIPTLLIEVGASRKPVMDAMHRLVADGYVEVLPQVGCKVVDRRNIGKKSSGRLSDVAYRFIKSEFIDGKYGLGEHINVDVLVERIGTSRQPVMDALRRMDTEGFVNIIPQVGCRVITPSSRDILDFYRIFAVTEGQSAVFAAERRTDDEIKKIENVMLEITAFKDRTKSVRRLASGYRMRNRRFHLCIHEMCKSEIVTSLIENYWDLSDFYISTAPGMHLFADRIEDSQAEHAEIINFLKNRDTARIRETVETHLLAFATQVVEANFSKNKLGS